jgi:DNA (cytosine-5)-methyltransferase 1
VQGDFDHIVPVVSPALNTQSGSHHAPDTKAYVAFAQNTRDEVRLVGGDGQIVGALAAQPGMKQTSYIAFDTTQISSPHNYSNPQSGDPCHPLAAGAHPPAVAFAIQDIRGVDKAQNGKGWSDEGVSYTVDTHATQGVAVAMASAVRRLTPVECELLQGFPDNFTGIPWKKKGPEHCPDGPRYKALGNSMAVPVMRWIGERIQIVDDLISLL